MSRNPPPQAQYRQAAPPGETYAPQWDEADWDHDEHDEAAGHRARRLLSRPSSGIHRVGDKLSAMQRWLAGERWVRRLAIVIS